MAIWHVCILLTIELQLVHKSKQDQIDAKDSGLLNQLYLNMFRVSSRPSSGQ
jgi:hypothetical protein